MIHGGGTLLAEGNEDWAAVGHPAAYSIGRDNIVFHAHDKQDGGKPKLRIREIKWEGSWPAITLKY
jgi:arabinan endo-1,5-alpha-L-arabinosidase